MQPQLNSTPLIYLTNQPLVVPVLYIYMLHIHTTLHTHT